MKTTSNKDSDIAEAKREEKRETKLLLSKARFFTLSWIGGIVFLAIAYVVYRQLM